MPMSEQSQFIFRFLVHNSFFQVTGDYSNINNDSYYYYIQLPQTFSLLAKFRYSHAFCFLLFSLYDMLKWWNTLDHTFVFSCLLHLVLVRPEIGDSFVSQPPTKKIVKHFFEQFLIWANTICLIKLSQLPMDNITHSVISVLVHLLSSHQKN